MTETIGTVGSMLVIRNLLTSFETGLMKQDGVSDQESVFGGELMLVSLDYRQHCETRTDLIIWPVYPVHIGRHRTTCIDYE